MNSANYVDNLVVDLRNKVSSGLITKSEAIWETGLACIGWSYVYSAWEDYCTPAERRKRFKMCPDKTSIKSKCQVIRDSNPRSSCDGCQWYPEGERTRCGDCRGFQDWLFKLFGFDLYGDTVSAQWNHKANWCAQGQFGVDPVPQNVYVSIFIKNKTTGKWTHTGGYFNGSTIECANGVQYFEKMKKDRWTHWAIAACLANGYKEPEKEPEKEPAKETTKVNRTIRKGNYGALVKECQTALQNLGYDLGICGVDGDFGQATEKAVKQFQKDHGLKQDGIVGQNTWTALQKAIGTSPPVVKYRVIIPNKTAEEADAIMAQYPGSTKEKEGS